MTVPDEFTLNIDGLALKTNPDVPYVGDLNPYDAQVRTLDALEGNSEFVAVNSSVTSGGKTYSWLYPACEQSLNVLGIFPRNALIEDQLGTMEDFIDEFFPDKRICVIHATGDSIEVLRSNSLDDNLSKGVALSRHIDWARKRHDSIILLTNPFVFTKIRRNQYDKNAFISRHLAHFNMVVLDEFHLVDKGGQNTMLAHLDEMVSEDDENQLLSKILFLSATPNEALQTILKEKFPSKYINLSKGMRQRPLSFAQGNENWRAVMPPVSLRVRKARTFDAASHMLSDENMDELIQFCRGGRTVIMVDAVKEVNQLYDELKVHLPDLVIHQITGMESERKMEKLDEFDVLVSNSCVEVGIDFEVERIIFSASTSDSFMQRLGRLRNQETPQPAICYLPHSVSDKLHRTITDKSRVSRVGLEWVIKDTYPDYGQNDAYSWMYSSLEYWYYVNRRSAGLTTDAKETYMADSVDRMARLFYEPYGRPFDRDEFRKIHERTHSRLLKEIQNYQVTGLQSLIYDPKADLIKTYNTISLLSNWHVECLSEREFYRQIPDRHHAQAKTSQSYTAGFIVLGPRKETNQSIEEKNHISLLPQNSPVLRREIAKESLERRPAIASGVSLYATKPEEIPGFDYLKEAVMEQKLLCYPVNGRKNDLTYSLSLGPFFRLDNVAGYENLSLAVGESALNLHCKIKARADEKGQEYIEELLPEMVEEAIGDAHSEQTTLPTNS